MVGERRSGVPEPTQLRIAPPIGSPCQDNEGSRSGEPGPDLATGRGARRIGGRRAPLGLLFLFAAALAFAEPHPSRPSTAPSRGRAGR
jgi:hypothetical protein